MNNDHNIQINTLSTMYVCMYVCIRNVYCDIGGLH